MRSGFFPLLSVIVCVGSCRQLSPDNSRIVFPLIENLICPRPTSENDSSSRSRSSRFPAMLALKGPAGVNADGGVPAGTYSAGMRTTRTSEELLAVKVAINPGGKGAGAAILVVAISRISETHQQRLSIPPNVPPASCPCLDSRGATTLLVFLSAPTWTRIIAAHLLRRFLLPRQHLHDQRRRLLMFQQIPHRLHVRID